MKLFYFLWNALWIKQNNITINYEIDVFKNVLIYLFSFNRLTELVISGRHYHLMKLDLSSNNISSVRGLRLDGLIHLSEINLSNNKLISLPPNSFSTSGMLR